MLLFVFFGIFLRLLFLSFLWNFLRNSLRVFFNVLFYNFFYVFLCGLLYSFFLLLRKVLLLSLLLILDEDSFFVVLERRYKYRGINVENKENKLGIKIFKYESNRRDIVGYVDIVVVNVIYDLFG